MRLKPPYYCVMNWQHYSAALPQNNSYRKSPENACADGRYFWLHFCIKIFSCISKAHVCNCLICYMLGVCQCIYLSGADFTNRLKPVWGFKYKVIAVKVCL